MSAFDQAFEHTVGLEGGYSKHPADRGGATNYGITEAVARENGYTGPMQDLPLETAKAIHKQRYWDPLRLENVASSSIPVAIKLFDVAINMGTGTAGKFLQRTLNALNRQQADYPDMTVDGMVGSKTTAAFNAFMDKRKQLGETVILKALGCLQGARYIELAEAREQNEAFVFGWLANRV